MIVNDFEYAGLNISLFDIASFISENNLSKNEKEYFLSQFENINKKDVQTMINFENILWYYWASYMYKLTNKQIFNIIKSEDLDRIVFLGDVTDVRYAINQQVGIEVKNIIRKLAKNFNKDIYFVCGGYN